jgi:glycosyltransferase involved in cell wall biosynthesis
VPDIARHNVTGLVAAPEDTKGFRDHIIELLENDALRDTMRQQCRKIALEEYSLSVQAKRYINVYRQLMNGTSEGHGASREP